jgi:hypothetical protein
MNQRENGKIEVVLGFVLGTVSIVIGYRLIAPSYNRTESIPLLSLSKIPRASSFTRQDTSAKCENSRDALGHEDLVLARGGEERI